MGTKTICSEYSSNVFIVCGHYNPKTMRVFCMIPGIRVSCIKVFLYRFHICTYLRQSLTRFASFLLRNRDNLHG